MLRTVTLLALLSPSLWSANVPLRETTAPAFIAQAMPGFYNGYLFSAEPSHVLTLFGPDGYELFSLPIQGHGNGKVHIKSAAIDSDGTLAVSWADGPNSGIDIRDLSGTLLRSIDTGAFLPTHLSFGPGQSLWALGWQRDAARWSVEKQDHAILRKYSIDGTETGAYLPKSLFPPGLPPADEGWQARRITVTADRVGVDVVSGKVSSQREWVELDLNGNVTGRWKLDPSDEFPGVVFTSDDQAYVHRYNRDTKSMQVFRLNRTTSTWGLVNAPNAELYGADGDKLVFAQWPDKVMHLSWFQQPERAGVLP
jgi:hypothetical protein